MLFRPLLGAPFPVPSLSCFIFYTRWSVLRRSRCSKVPVSASLSKGRPDSLISIPDSPPSTPSCNLRPPFHISLPTTKSLRRHSHYAHCQPLQVNLWQSILVASYLLIGIQHLLQSSPFWNNRCLFGRLTCVLSALPISP